MQEFYYNPFAKSLEQVILVVWRLNESQVMGPNLAVNFNQFKLSGQIIAAELVGNQSGHFNPKDITGKKWLNNIRVVWDEGPANLSRGNADLLRNAMLRSLIRILDQFPSDINEDNLKPIVDIIVAKEKLLTSLDDVMVTAIDLFSKIAAMDKLKKPYWKKLLKDKLYTQLMALKEIALEKNAMSLVPKSIDNFFEVFNSLK